jgi:hypothetical protein
MDTFTDISVSGYYKNHHRSLDHLCLEVTVKAADVLRYGVR